MFPEDNADFLPKIIVRTHFQNVITVWETASESSLWHTITTNKISQTSSVESGLKAFVKSWKMSAGILNVTEINEAPYRGRRHRLQEEWTHRPEPHILGWQFQSASRLVGKQIALCGIFITARVSSTRTNSNSKLLNVSILPTVNNSRGYLLRFEYDTHASF